MRIPHWLLALALALPYSANVSAAPERFVLDPSHVSIGFLIGHARFAQVLGLFSDVSGEFVYDADTQTLNSGKVEIRGKSVFTGHEKRDEHVRGDDFLATDAHPIMTFQATDYTASSDRAGVLEGDLTIRGVTQPIALDVTLNRRADHPIGGADTLGGSARGVIERSAFDMSYALEGDLVSDAVELLIEFEATHEPR